MSGTSTLFRHLQHAAGILMLGTFSVYAMGFVKSLFIAGYYGTSGQLDAYFLSLSPINVITGILVGAVQAALIPTYLDLFHTQGNEAAFTLLGTIIAYILACLTGVACLFGLGASQLASWLGAGFDAAQVEFTASLLKISSLFLVLTVFSNLSLCLFQAHREFTFPAFIPLLSGGISLGYIIMFRSQGVPSLLQSLIVGMGIQNLVILFAARDFFPTRFRILSPWHAEVRHTLKVMTPLLIGSSFGHINVLVDQMMASTLPSGSISALHYAAKLHSIITHIFIIAVSKALLPFFAKQVTDADWDGLSQTFRSVIKITLLILIPVSIGVFLVGTPFIRLVFQRGAFTGESTLTTAYAWKAYAVGLTVQAIGIFTAKVYNALQDNTTLMYVSAAGIGLNIVCNSIGMYLWGHIGIALSTSVVYAVMTGILLSLLQQKTGLLWKTSE